MIPAIHIPVTAHPLPVAHEGDSQPLRTRQTTVLHGMQNVLYSPVASAWRDEDKHRFVFITDGVEPAFVAQVLENFSLAV